MSGGGDPARPTRAAGARREPQDPDEVFSALITRLIATNEEERAGRSRAAAQRRPGVPAANEPLEDVPA